MEILGLLSRLKFVKTYEVVDYEKWSSGFYYKIKLIFKNDSELHVKEYFDKGGERNYSYHWQDKNADMIIRWDNAPHHKKLLTYPHHKHIENKIYESSEITLTEVLEYIQRTKFK